MASISLTPNPANVGNSVIVEGLDFLPSTLVTVTVQSPNGRMGIFSSQITSDASGEIASTDIANYATSTYTLSANPAAADTITIGSKTYTYRASVSTTANEILIGGTPSATLDNVKSAINLDGNTAVYGSATTINADVRASTKTATTLFLVAKVGGTAGNSLATTKVGTNGSFTGATLAGGAAASGNYTWTLAPQGAGIWVITASDGTNTATANLQVFHSA